MSLDELLLEIYKHGFEDELKSVNNARLIINTYYVGKMQSHHYGTLDKPFYDLSDEEVLKIIKETKIKGVW